VFVSKAFIAALLAFGFSCYLTPLFRKVALKYNILDKPDGKLKHQEDAIPYLGGLAIYLAFIMSLSLVFDFDRSFLGLLLGATLIVLLGVFDDLIELSPLFKLLGQFLAFWVLFRSGIRIELINLSSGIAVGLSFVWLIVVTNAFNIIDVSDGLAAGVAIVGSAFLGALGILGGDALLAFMGLSLHGALWGFWIFNKCPAKIYLGDSGSLLIGFLFAALTLRGAYTETQALGFLVPLCLLAVPLFDVAFVSVARLSRGISPLQGSPDHFAIRLKRSGYSSNQVMFSSMIVSMFMGTVGVLLMFIESTYAIYLLSGTFVLFLSVFIFLWRLSPVEN